MSRENSPKTTVARAQIYVKMTGVPGTSKREGKEKYFEADTVGKGHSLPAGFTQNTRDASDSVAHPIRMTRSPDAASAVIELLAVTGKKIDEMEIEVFGSARSKTPIRVDRYTDVCVTGFESTVEVDGQLIETITYSYGTHEWEYYDTKGTLVGGSGYDWIKGSVMNATKK